MLAQRIQDEAAAKAMYDHTNLLLLSSIGRVVRKKVSLTQEKPGTREGAECTNTVSCRVPMASSIGGRGPDESRNLRPQRHSVSAG
jgi:hypothetical protein